MSQPSLSYEFNFLTKKAELIRANIAEIDVALSEIYAEIARQEAEEKEADRWKD